MGYPSQAKNGIGTIVKMMLGGTLTSIAEVKDVDGPNPDSDELEVTNFDSQNGYREFIPGFKDPGQITLAMNFVPSDPTQNPVTGIISLYEAQTLTAFQVSWPQFPSNPKVDFSAFIKSYNPPTTVGAAIQLTVILRVSGAYIWS